MKRAGRALWALIKRVAATALKLVKSDALPMWLRVLYAATFFVCHVVLFFLPIDDVLFIVPIGITMIFPAYRLALLTAWRDSAPVAL